MSKFEGFFKNPEEKKSLQEVINEAVDQKEKAITLGTSYDEIQKLDDQNRVVNAESDRFNKPLVHNSFLGEPFDEKVKMEQERLVALMKEADLLTAKIDKLEKQYGLDKISKEKDDVMETLQLMEKRFKRPNDIEWLLQNPDYQKLTQKLNHLSNWYETLKQNSQGVKEKEALEIQLEAINKEITRLFDVYGGPDRYSGDN